jgi:dethiobiotin synthetase
MPSNRAHSRGLFVTGTDTDVGKTAVAVAIVSDLVRRGMRVGVYKPVASGADGAMSDAARLWEAAGRPLTLEAVCPQAFRAAIAPVQAAALEGRRVDEQLLRTGFHAWPQISDQVVVEGAGSLFSPLGEDTLNVHVARDLGLPLVVVDAARLGAIGRTLGTVRAARAEGLEVALVVLSCVAPLDGDPHDPRTTAGVVRDALEALAARLRPIPVRLLAHGADRLTA